MKRLSLLLFLLVFVGCAHGPSEKAKQELSPARVAETIVKGKTTKEQVLAAFGTPNTIDKNPRALPKDLLEKITVPMPPISRTVEFWNYWSATPAPGGIEEGKANVYRVMFYIDEKGVVVDYQAEESTAILQNP